MRNAMAHGGKRQLAGMARPAPAGHTQGLPRRRPDASPESQLYRTRNRNFTVPEFPWSRRFRFLAKMSCEPERGPIAGAMGNYRRAGLLYTRSEA